MAEAAEDAPPSFDAVNDDPFKILGVDSSATDDEIKAAYRKLVLKYHPDKNPGDAQAELMFQRVQTAHGILSNPELRAKYDAGGLAALDDASLQQHGLQVDVSQTGIVGSTLLAMFRKLGHPIKTVVSPVVMDAVKDRNIASVPLEWGVPLKGKVGNGQAVFYELSISQEQITQGFIIQASCLHARVKLLLWDMNTVGEWSLAAQEDAIKLGDCNVSALYNVGADLLEGVPKSVQTFVQQQSMVEKQGSDPLNHIFRALDTAKLRDPLSLKPGTHLLAVYGDNFFKRSQYTVAATLQTEGLQGSLQQTERTIIEKRAELLAFEKDFKKARAEFETAVTKLEGFTKDLDDLFAARDKEYQGILGLPASSGSGPSNAARGQDGADTPEGGSTVGGGLGNATTQIYGGMTEAGKMVRSAGSQITGAFKGLWGKQGKGAGAATGGGSYGGETGDPSGLPGGTRVAHPTAPTAPTAPTVPTAPSVPTAPTEAHSADASQV